MRNIRSTHEQSFALRHPSRGSSAPSRRSRWRRPSFPGAAAQAPVEGTNYVRLKNQQPTESGKNIEVLEFFSYGCPHCGELEPQLQAWLKTKPADVTFRRVPVMFQPRWENLAKIYYTLDAMGEEAKLAPEIFTAIHGKGVQLWNEKDFLDWAAAKGLDRKKVEDMFKSFAIVGQGQPREAARGRVRDPVGADDRRRRQVLDGAGTHGRARRDAGHDRRAGRQGARRTTEVVAPRDARLPHRRVVRHR